MYVFLFIETSIKYERIDTATNIPNQSDTNNLKKNIDESVSNVLYLILFFIFNYKNLLYICIFLYLFISIYIFFFFFILVFKLPKLDTK